jgi:hypothetical protein
VVGNISLIAAPQRPRIPSLSSARVRIFAAHACPTNSQQRCQQQECAMNQIVRRLFVAVTLALISTGAMAGDWLWREQVQLSTYQSKALNVRVGSQIPALISAPWREQVYRHKLPLLITVPVHAAPPQTALLWREQVVTPAITERGATAIRISGDARGDNRRQ